LEHVMNERIPFKSMAQIVHEDFLIGREVIVVAGTHGKTTTTSMLAWIFESAGLKPSFLIGGIAENFGSSYALRPTKPFINERDGSEEVADWSISHIRYEPEKTSWNVRRMGLPLAEFEFAMAGEYNVLNATAAAAMALNCNVALDAVVEGVRTFKSVKRRLEV